LDPIDGKASKPFFALRIWNSKKQRAFSALTERHRLLWLYLNEKTDFLLQKKKESIAFLRLNRLFTNCSETKKT
jgi:hypothetical protein